MSQPLRIAFIACNKNPERFHQDASYIYRCLNPGLALQAAGHQVTFEHISRVSTNDRFDIVQVHRPRHSLSFRWHLRRLRKQSAVMMADIDDLILSEEHASYSPAVLNGLLTERQIHKQFRDNRRALASFDRFTVSTEPLKAQLLRQIPQAKVKVVPNCVHHQWLSLNTQPTRSPEQLRLTYFPGTRSHERDFKHIEPVIAEFLHQQPGVTLEITGHLDTHINARPGQITRMDKLPFYDYVARVQHSWVNLCPLEPTPFNECKSALKVIEAAYWGTPTLASPIPDTQRLAGYGAVLAHNDQDWLDQLTQLLNPDHYRQASHQLSQRILEQADIRQHAPSLLEWASQ